MLVPPALEPGRGKGGGAAAELRREPPLGGGKGDGFGGGRSEGCACS